MKTINLSAKSRWTFFYFSFALFIMAIARCLIFAFNYQYFSPLDLSSTIIAFLDGVRFDFSTLLLYTAVPTLLLTLPIYKKFWYYPLALLNIVLFLSLFMLIASDIAFFNESHYHIGNHLLIIGSDLSFVVQTAISEYFYYIIATILLAIFMIRKMIRIWKDGDHFIAQPWYTFFPKFIILGIIIFYGVNGKVGIKIDRMISTSDAFSGGSIEYGNLVLNGGFTTFQVIKEKRWKNKTKHFNSDEAISVVQESLKQNGVSFIDKDFPLLRKRDSFQSFFPVDKKMNLMIIMLESWSSEYIDFFSGKKAGNTPHFDQIAKNGISFNNFYPNGTMSLYGISSILTSLPPTPRVPALGKGLEVYNLMRPGAIFNKRGYETIAAQSSIRVSFRFNTIAKYLGFNEYYGKEDYPRVHKLESPSNGWDDEMYSFLLKRFEEVKVPFFSFIFTGTTHIPYMVPDDKFKIHPHGPKDMNGFYNTLYFSDQKLGEFIDTLRTKSWFDDTLFVFVADHTLKRETYGNNAKIPFVLYAPKYLKPKVIDTLGSQVDIIPTIFDLLHIDAPYSGVGKSMFLKGDDPFVLSERSRRVGILNKHGVLQHDINKRISNSMPDTFSLSSEKELLSAEQVIWEAIEANRVHR